MRKEGEFLRLLLSTSIKQRQAMLKTIEKTQLSAIVQIVFNVLMGNRELNQSDKNSLKKCKTVIHRFVSKTVSDTERKPLFLKYSLHIIKILNAVKKELKHGSGISSNPKN